PPAPCPYAVQSSARSGNEQRSKSAEHAIASIDTSGSEFVLILMEAAPAATRSINETTDEHSAAPPQLKNLTTKTRRREEILCDSSRLRGEQDACTPEHARCVRSQENARKSFAFCKGFSG